MPPELRLIPGQTRFDVSLVGAGTANGPRVIDDQLVAVPRAFPRLFLPLSLLSGAPPALLLIAMAFTDGLDDPVHQPAGARLQAADLLACLAVIVGLAVGLPGLVLLGDLPMLSFERSQPRRGLPNDPQQDSAGRIRIGWRDRCKIPHAQPDLVLLEMLCGHVAADLLKGVLVTRLDGMAGEEHLGDLRCARRIDRLFAQ